MNTTNTKRFLWHWCRYAIRDAAAQAFGWPTLVSAAVLGYLLPKLGVGAISNQIANNIAIAVVSWAVGFAVYLFAAFFKAHRFTAPLALSITDDVRSPDFTCNDQIRGYSVAAIVQNRSDVHWKDCTAHVMNAPLCDGSTGPRFVEKFDLPPKSKKTVYIAYWFSRKPPNPDDKDIGLTGPVAACWGGNVCRVPGSGTNLHIRIRPQDAASKDVHCRVWIDTAARRLRAAQSDR
ncbi:hypothetical protein [Paraburkholderia atlantica]|uniref:hypothetical protein n=1 Tax=Paraburkholderia atlantica TaxID=2654982 RepID=UPI00161BF5B3|nr:hypothetical protein [Paraburkholderia atlantica]MBB5508724.1 hypothetical protein [Paraburkholderia atlantica]